MLRIIFNREAGLLLTIILLSIGFGFYSAYRHSVNANLQSEYIQKIAIFNDDDGILTTEQVFLLAGLFRHRQNSKGISYRAGTTWVSFELALQPGQRIEESLIELSQPLVSNIHLYAVSYNGLLEERQDGRPHVREFEHWKPALQIGTTASGSSRFMLRFTSASSGHLRLRLIPVAQINSRWSADSLYYSLFFASGLGLLLFQLLYWRGMGDHAVSSVVFNAASLLIIHACLLGLLMPSLGSANFFSQTSPCMLWLIWQAVAAISFLGLYGQMSHSTRYWRCYASFAVIACVLGILAERSGHHETEEMVLIQTTGVAILLLLLRSIHYLRSRRRWLGYFLVAHAAYSLILLSQFIDVPFVGSMESVREIALEAMALTYLALGAANLALSRRIGERQVQPELDIQDNAISAVPIAKGNALISSQLDIREILEEGLRDLVDEVNVTLQEERTSNREYRELVAMVSHEFRAPLAVIDILMQRLSESMEVLSVKDQQRHQNIRAAVQRMRIMMDDYLTLDRANSFDARRFDRCSVITLLQDLVAEWPEDRMLLDVPTAVPLCSCDVELLRIAIRNLIANAIRHSYPGRPVCVSVTLNINEELEISVVNEGNPIAENELPMLFQKNYRGREGKLFPGSGLGLYLVSKIAKLHRGAVQAESYQGKTKFTVKFPLQRAS